MKSFNVQKVISIICSVIGFTLSLCWLLIALQSLGTDALGQMGVVIFILPLLIIILDFLITIGKIKRGLIYSCISTLIKIIIIILIIPVTMYDYKDEMQDGVSNLDFDLIIIFFLIMAAIPSILNIINFILKKKK